MRKDVKGTTRYNHDDWKTGRQICRFLLHYIGFKLLAKIENVEGLENIPDKGPAILMMNHIAFVDPVVLVYVIPRDIVPLAKEEVYEYPVWGYFTRLWGVIPVRREGLDRRAVQMALNVLQAGEILLVAPEATRNLDLQRGREGVAYLASRSAAPVIPVALENTSGFPTLPFSRRWWGPGARVRIGKSFQFRHELKRARGKMLRKMADEAMYILAAMLPPQRRGVYSDLNVATRETILG